VESRWRLEPRHGARSSAWQLSRLRARTAPEADWTIRYQAGRAMVAEPLAETA
ncbi:hypothetical protein HKCCE3408_13735, partial [Rhodobacterales bacterium HKCCE3408]|nr:hypothetical protein [Rhodobacterales bacterium HKCCE3408]